MAGQRVTLLVAIHGYIETALWAALAVGVALFAIFVAPGIPEAQRRSQAERVAAFERECDFYCTKWGLQHGTPRHSACVSDLHHFRDGLVTQLSAEFF
jgi:hypothetical protein